MSALMGLFCVFIVSFIVLAVFGTVVLTILACCAAIAFAILGAFWPFILVAFILYYLCREKRSEASDFIN